MAGNADFPNNGTQWMNKTNITYYRPRSFDTFYITSMTADAIFFLVGTFLNLWFLVATLSSPELRSKMRNKVISCTLIVHLSESMIVCPLSFGRIVAILTNNYLNLNCTYETVHNNIYHIADFVGNWLIVILLAVFIAQILNFELKLLPIWIKILTFTTLIAPWVFSILFVPLTMNTYYSRYYDDECLVSTYDAIRVYKSLDTVVPQLLAGILLITAVILKCTRYPHGRAADSFRAQLLESGPEIDPTIPFVAVVVTAILCDLMLMVIFLSPLTFIRLGLDTWIHLFVSFNTIALSRVIFVPVMLLLFPDIRERIKTWTPWRRSPANLDLVITYQKNAAEGHS